MVRILPPHPALRPFVKGYWYLHLQHQENALSFPLSPVPETCLYFYPKDALQIQKLDDSTAVVADNLIAGQITLRHNLLIPNNYVMFKVQLQPAAFFRLFGLPMTLFAGGSEDMTLVIGHEIKEIRERIINAATFEEMVGITESFLLRKIGTYKVAQHPIDLVLKQVNFHQYSLDQLADDACLSSRQFERKFLERTGVSPKFYSRIVRFNQAMKIKQQSPELSWLHIAYDCGYFDHNHLLRDFKQFTGEVPSSFDFEQAVIY